MRLRKMMLPGVQKQAVIVTAAIRLKSLCPSLSPGATFLLGVNLPAPIMLQLPFLKAHTCMVSYDQLLLQGKTNWKSSISWLYWFARTVATQKHWLDSLQGDCLGSRCGKVASFPDWEWKFYSKPPGFPVSDHLLCFFFLIFSPYVSLCSKFLFILVFYFCVYVCVYKCVNMWIPGCMHVEARGQCWLSSSITLYLIFWARISLNLELINWLDCMASKLRDPPITTPPPVQGLQTLPPYPGF